VVAGVLTGCDGDDRPLTLPSSVALPSGVPDPVVDQPGGDAQNQPPTPVTAGPAAPAEGGPGDATSPAGTAPVTAPGTPDGSGNGLCLDPNSELVTSAIAGLEPAPPEGTTWRLRQASEDPISDGCEALLSYVAVEWPEGMHPGVHLLFFTEGQPTQHIWYYEHPYPEGVKSYNKTKPIRIEEFDAEKAWWGSEADGFAGRVENERAWKVGIDQIRAANFNLDQKNPHAPEQESHDPDELLRRYASLQAEAQALRDQLKAILAESLSGARA